MHLRPSFLLFAYLTRNNSKYRPLYTFGDVRVRNAIDYQSFHLRSFYFREMSIVIQVVSVFLYFPSLRHLNTIHFTFKSITCFTNAAVHIDCKNVFVFVFKLCRALQFLLQYGLVTAVQSSKRLIFAQIVVYVMVCYRSRAVSWRQLCSGSCNPDYNVFSAICAHYEGL